MASWKTTWRTTVQWKDGRVKFPVEPALIFHSFHAGTGIISNHPTNQISTFQTSGRCLLSWRRYLKAYGKHPGTADKRALCFNPSMRPSDFEERFIGKTSGISVGFFCGKHMFFFATKKWYPGNLSIHFKMVVSIGWFQNLYMKNGVSPNIH